ncbi:MAG: M23 family metallopeptidase [Anaerolineales bacterium]|nr:M23 family metallopeptidase [Anaerolineales bacterium]MBX3036483.1 M23 family metallopeptidase [Anaerolineales bacterium]
MKFQAPIGTEEERNSGKIWPGGWTDATGFLNAKAPGYAYGIHTGADLNLNVAGNWDADRLAPVYSIGDGIVTYAQTWPNPNYWGNIIVIDHGMVDGKPLYSRYAHVANIRVRPGEVVKMGQQICQVGDGSSAIRPKAMFPFHLHFDISYTKILREQPQNWPAPSTNKNKALVVEHYVDPEKWLKEHHTVESLPKAISGNTTSSESEAPTNTPPRTNIAPSLPTWYVIAPEVTIYKQPNTTSQKSGSLSRGKQIFMSTGGVRNQGMDWGKIVGSTFEGDWVAIRKSDQSESYLSTNRPQ